MHPCELPDRQLLTDCDVRRQRRSGPGGQHRNKVESAIVLVHRPSGVRAEATERRNQHENRRVALKRLRLELALDLRSERPPDGIPTSRWTTRAKQGAFRVDPQHEDFAPLLAEALDVIEQQHYDVAAAARSLRISSSQLIRFLKLEPRALRMVNQTRQSMGLHRLH
ncbi:MAG: peptide chain release factor family protein [Planctomycetota bacterium]